MNGLHRGNGPPLLPPRRPFIPDNEHLIRHYPLRLLSSLARVAVLHCLLTHSGNLHTESYSTHVLLVFLCTAQFDSFLKTVRKPQTLPVPIFGAYKLIIYHISKLSVNICRIVPQFNSSINSWFWILDLIKSCEIPHPWNKLLHTRIKILYK